MNRHRPTPLRAERLFGIRAAGALVGCIAVAAAQAPAAKPARSPISGVRISPAAFIPTLGESVRLSAQLSSAGRLRAEVLDRDGFVVRTLASDREAKAGPLELTWNGRDDSGVVVANEAYSFRIELTSKAGAYVYDPADAEMEMATPKAAYYDRVGGRLVYDLPWPARVHAQAGAAALDPQTNKRNGPMMKTLVNREPRTGGRVIEAWNGYDEGGTIYVPDLPGFSISIMATRLPTNAVLAVGGRGPSFIERAVGRKGPSRFRFRPAHHHHHLGLDVFQDVSPALEMEVEGAVCAPGEAAWSSSGRALRVRVQPTGPSATGFAALPASLHVFRDLTELRRVPVTGEAMSVEIPASELTPGVQVITVCWASEYGPSATTAFRLTSPGPKTPGREGGEPK